MSKSKIIIGLLFFIAIVSLTNCRKKVKGCIDAAAENYNPNATADDGSCIYNSVKTVGQTYGGGIVFYVDATGKHGLIAATTDQGNSRPWSNGTITATGASGTAVGTGQTNTSAIVSTLGAGTYAGSICNDLVLGSYSDWFLPSKGELLLMYTNLASKSLGGFAFAEYWSSTEADASDAYSVDFNSGSANKYPKINSKSVRPVRAF